MSDTPRTDALLAKWHGEWGADALLTLTRELERELHAMTLRCQAADRTANAALAARPEERAREGWRLVPTEATAEMIQAAEDRQIEGANYIAESSIQFALWREVWRAMLKAAPPMNSGRDS